MKKILLIGLSIFGVLIFLGIVDAATTPEGKKSFEEGRNNAKQVVEGNQIATTMPTNDSVVNTKPTSTPKPTTQPQTPEKAIESKIRGSLKTKTSDGKNKIVEIRINKSFADDSAGKYVVLVTINADDNLTNELTKKGIWIDMSDIYIALYKNSNNIAQATVIAHAVGVDKYGKESDQVVLKTMLTESEAKKVNWNADKSMLELSILPDVWETQTNRF